MEQAGVLDRAEEPDGALLKARIRLSSLDDELFVHAAYPPLAADSVFFDRDNFRHEARLCDDPFRVEAHLVAVQAASYRIGDRIIAFAAGESVRTDTSHKYPPDAFRALATAAGWAPVGLWIDDDNGFSLHLFRA